MTGSILTLNAGSSSLKFALFDARSLKPELRGEITDIDAAPRLRMEQPATTEAARQVWPPGRDYADIIADLLDLADRHAGRGGVTAVGHRIVHGGCDHVAPERMTPSLLDRLTTLTPLDPLHLPHNLAAVRAIAAARANLVQVACFDTAFHHTMPAVARTVALPAAVAGRDIRRYGFHGLSYEYIARHLANTAPDLLQGRVIVAHLGAGASLCALKGGASIATTMGFSVLDGLVMATRCGTIDPGIILHLGRMGHSFAEIEDMLYHRSGLLGVSGISGDMRVLLASDAPDAGAAIDLFTYRVAIEASGLVGALGGLDGLVFTAGIGEQSAAIRAAVCARLAWLGLHLDDRANATGAETISTSGSDVDVRMIATDEEAMIAHHCRAVIASGSIAQPQIDVG